MAGAAAAALITLLSLSDPEIRASLRWREARDPSALEAASLFLRDLDAAPSDTSGVLTKWDYGHTVLSVAGRPVVAAGFGPWPGEQGFREVMSALQGDEPSLVELMQRRRLDFLVTGLYAFLPSVHVADPDADPPFWVSPRDGQVEINLDFFAERPLSPLILGGTGLSAAGVAHAAHLRPRFVSPQRIPGLGGAPIFEFWVYERVAGARLRGTAPAGARVVARDTDHTARDAPRRTRRGPTRDPTVASCSSFRCPRASTPKASRSQTTTRSRWTGNAWPASRSRRRMCRAAPTSSSRSATSSQSEALRPDSFNEAAARERRYASSPQNSSRSLRPGVRTDRGATSRRCRRRSTGCCRA